jgi:hypothetical protein
MKNRDWPLDRAHRPIYYPATSTTFAVVAINEFTMGINEKGLAVMNTAMPALESEPAYGNLALNQKILEKCESVAEVAQRLNDSRDILGPNYRYALGTIATCVGVVDRFGAGAFFEISNTQAYAEHVADGYATRANTPRIYPGYSHTPGGRDLYLLNALDEVNSSKGIISWQDVMQSVSRYVRHKELGSHDFSFEEEACNSRTVASMVAVSGDERYDGKLNCMWASCGPNPITGLFAPSMVLTGEPPDELASLWSHIFQKYVGAQTTADPIVYLDPYRVREVQSYAFFAENYTCNEYDHLMSTVPDNLTDNQLRMVLSEYIDRVSQYATEVYINEDFDILVPERIVYTFPTQTTTTETASTTTDTSSTTVSTTNGTTQNKGLPAQYIVELAIGASAGLAVVVILGMRKIKP